MAAKTHPETSAAAFAPQLARAASILREAALETLWPTRCAICDEPGVLLCDRCRRNLAYVDTWQACPRCGAPFGRNQCTECNSTMMDVSQRDALPFAGCASVVVFDEFSSRLATIYKDHGERRLSETMGQMMARVCPPAWRNCPVCFVPATKAAVRRRGFDHAQLLAERLADCLGARVIPLFDRPRSHDQRELTRRQRYENMRGRMQLTDQALRRARTGALPRKMLLVDDVYTTGATLCDCCDRLAEFGVETFCLTYARVL